MKPSPVRLYREIGRRIREHRHHGNLTQEALARALDLTRAAVSNIETGRQQIYIHTLYQVAAALKLEVAKLLPDPSVIAADPLDISLAKQDIGPASRKRIMAVLKSHV